MALQRDLCRTQGELQGNRHASGSGFRPFPMFRRQSQHLATTPVRTVERSRYDTAIRTIPLWLASCSLAITGKSRKRVNNWESAASLSWRMSR
jgi:hypothetical protein